MALTITNVSPSAVVDQPANLDLEFDVDLASAADVELYVKRDKSNNVALRFAIYSEGHWGYSPMEYEDEHDAALAKINDYHAANPVDFIVANGDLVHDNVDFHAELKTAFLSQLDMPYYPVFGNHDWCTEAEWITEYGISRNYSFESGDYGFILAKSGVELDASDYVPGDDVWVKNQIDGFSDKKGVFIFQHISPLELSQDAYAAPDNNMRVQYARDEVLMTFHGHHHQVNYIREIQDNLYAYACRISGVDLGGNGFPDIDYGFRVVTVYDDNTVDTKQVKISDDATINQDDFYNEDSGYRPVKTLAGSSGSQTVTHTLNSLNANATYYWYAESGGEQSAVQSFTTDDFGEGIITQDVGVLMI